MLSSPSLKHGIEDAGLLNLDALGWTRRFLFATSDLLSQISHAAGKTPQERFESQACLSAGGKGVLQELLIYSDVDSDLSQAAHPILNPFFPREGSVRFCSLTIFLPRCGRGEKWEKAKGMSKAELPGGHADDGETDMMMHVNGDLVDVDAISPDKDAGASKLDFDIAPAEAQTWWYSEFPDSLAGDPRFPSKERGRLLTEAIVEGLADTLIRIRDDEKVAGRNRMFEEEAGDPSKMR